ncbi:MAG: hypothetical protein ACRDIB_10895 [Ardenticatenaceae bacterium]
MRLSIRPTHLALCLWLLGGVFSLLHTARPAVNRFGAEPDSESKGRRGSGVVEEVVVGAPAGQGVTTPQPPTMGFAPQTRLGYHAGDQWEPAIAADRFGHIYLLYPQYLGVPGCPRCPSPTMVLQISDDHGATWGAPAPIGAPGSGQWDAQIVVDPVNEQTVYAAWLQNNRSATVVARSDDFGATWSSVVAGEDAQRLTDKPILAARGQDVYVAFNRARHLYVAASHDGGATFTTVEIPKEERGWPLAGGGAVTPDGSVYFSWAGYLGGFEQTPVNLYLIKSADGGATWTTIPMDISTAGPDCSAYECGWAYLGAQIVLASDEAGSLYALWNKGRQHGGPQRIFFARSTDGGASWSDKVGVSVAPAGTGHAFPAIVAGSAGDVRISWMDAREEGLWNTYYRSSMNGGLTWTPESDLSTYVPGFPYIEPHGFSFPFGDYFELAIGERGMTHVVWGEGLNYDSPGSIWYTRGR